MKKILKSECSQAFNKIWSFTKDKETKIILSILKGESRRDFGYVLSSNESLASSRIKAALISCGFPYISSSIPINKTSDYYKNNNLILIGGPRKNKITKEIMEKAKNPLTYNFDDQSILAEDNGTKKPILKNKDKDSIAHALITKMPNQFNKERVVLIIAGYRYIDTLITVDFLTNSDLVKNISNLNTEYFQMVIEIEKNDIDPYISIVYPNDLGIPKIEIPPNMEAVCDKPIVNIFTTDVIPEKKIYILLAFLFFTLFFNSLSFLFFWKFSTIFFLPLFGSLSVLFYLPLKIWEKYKVITINPISALFGYYLSIICFITALGGIIVRFLLKI